MRSYLDFEVCRVDCRRCGKAKCECLEFVTDNPLIPSALPITLGDGVDLLQSKISEELKLDRHAVKELAKQYMVAQLAKAGYPGPKVIGIDEISISKRHIYRIVINDLVWRRGPFADQHD
jgi:transposase